MKRLLAGFSLLLVVALPGAAQERETVARDVLVELAESSAVGGYEEKISDWLAARLVRFAPAVDNLGNVVVTVGSGSPHRLLVTHIDEPGYVVSAVTEDGYLRVQRLPQRGVHPWFDLLHSTQPAAIVTRDDQQVPGIVAGLSVHIHRDTPIPPAHLTDDLERIYIDVGARSPEEVRALGIRVLDPLTLEKQSYELANGRVSAPFLSDRAGAAALVAVFERLDKAKLEGTLTAAFVTRHYLGNQGLSRLLSRVDPDEAVFLGRLEKSPAQPGDGVLVANFEGMEPGLAAELLKRARENNLATKAELPEAAPRGRYFGRLPLPARSAVVGLPVRFPQTPAEIISRGDLSNAVKLLEAWLGLPAGQEMVPARAALPAEARGFQADVEHILPLLVQPYGVSGYEEPVAEQIKEMLPPWAKEWATVDGRGNLFVPFGQKNPDKPRLLFVAHMDEIGWVVKEIHEDGRLVLERRGGFLGYHFTGHPVFIHVEQGRVPAVLELPGDYREVPYSLAQERQPHIAYTGALSREQAEALGIQAGDPVTVPKKYRRLAGSRVSARSFDDRVGSAALAAALWQLNPEAVDREVIFLWAVEEEIGLFGAKHFAGASAAGGEVADFVFPVDTFVSADSPLESPRYARGILGKGFVLRAVDHSNVAPRRWVERVIALARKNNIPVQWGVTGGGNDGAAFVPYGAVDIPLGWPLRYSHSPGEVADLTDVRALADIVAALAKDF